MLYILAGASRSGKSTLARRFVVEKQTPFFCIDSLINSLQVVPHLGIHHELPFIEKAEKLWPLVEPLLAGLVCDEPTYLIEGDSLLPKNIATLRDRFGSEINACLVGFTDVSPEDKFHEVRMFSKNKDDWTHDFTDEKLLEKITAIIEYSKYLRVESEKYDFKYFDCSHNFQEYLEEVFTYLTHEQI